MNHVHESSDSIAMAGPQSGRRRRFTTAEKQKFLIEATGPGESVSSVGRRYGLSVSLLFRWRRQMDKAGTSGASMMGKSTAGERAPAGTAQLRMRVRELERLLGERSTEIDQMRRRLMLRAEGLDAGALVGGVRPANMARDGEA